MFAVGRALCAIGLVAQIASARTTRATARLEWERTAGGEQCLDDASLRAAVNGRWGRDVFTDTPRADITLRGSVGPDGSGGWLANIELRDEKGQPLGSRNIRTAASDCSALDDSIALAVGIMLDLSLERLEEQAKAPPEPPPPIVTPEETWAPRAKTRFDIGVGAETLFGLFTRPPVGLTLRVGATPRRFWRTEVGATWFLGMEHFESAGDARFSAWSIDASICPFEFETRNVQLFACAMERAGQVRAAGAGFTTNHSSDELLLTVGSKGVANWTPVPPLFFRLAVKAEVALTRYRFVYRDESSQKQAFFDSSRVLPGVEAQFGLHW